MFRPTYTTITKPCKILIATGSFLFLSLLHLFPALPSQLFLPRRLAEGFPHSYCVCYFFIFSFGREACYGLVLNFVLDHGGSLVEVEQSEIQSEMIMLLSNFITVFSALAPENSPVISFWQHHFCALNKSGLMRASSLPNIFF